MEYKTVNIWCSDKEVNSAGDSPESRRKKILPQWSCAGDHPYRAKCIHSSLHYLMLVALLTILFLACCFSAALVQLSIVVLQYKHQANRGVLIASGEPQFVFYVQ